MCYSNDCVMFVMLLFIVVFPLAYNNVVSLIFVEMYGFHLMLISCCPIMDFYSMFCANQTLKDVCSSKGRDL